MIVTPNAASRRTGNAHTAARYAAFLREMGALVRIVDRYDGEKCDLLIALHAKKSGRSVLDFVRDYPDRPVVVVLTGTDLYRDLARSKTAHRALDAATAIVVLQPNALRHLRATWRRKATAIVQSAIAPRVAKRQNSELRVAVLGHLRAEKDPLRAARALRFIPRTVKVRVIQAGAALQPRYAAVARELEKRDARYRFLGEVSHSRATSLLARSDAIVVASRMEGGANVVSEAIAANVPVLASRISGNVGLLGAKYPAYFPVGDSRACAALIARCGSDRAFLNDLRRRMKALQPLVRPLRERQKLQRVVKRALSS